MVVTYVSYNDWTSKLQKDTLWRKFMYQSIDPQVFSILKVYASEKDQGKDRPTIEQAREDVSSNIIFNREVIRTTIKSLHLELLIL